MEINKKPAAEMWEYYRTNVLTDMGDASTEVCRNVFYAGMGVALSYFINALRGSQPRFNALMQALDDELSEELPPPDRTIN